MSSFPAQFVDMTVDRGLFDHTGAQPPATKITIELPPEYIEKPEPDATPPYSEFRVDAKVLADIQTAVMREYGGVARRCLNAFRQDVGLGDLAINGRRTNLGAGVGMSYASHFGNESIRIHVSKEGVRRLLGSEEDLYMLVLYGDNQIAYIPMKSIKSPSGGVKKRTLENSSWNRGFSGTGAFADMFPMSQLKLSKTVHALMAPFKISEDGVVTSNDTQRYVMYNTLDTLLRNDDCADYITWWDYANIIMNGSGNTVYNNLGDKFEYSSENGIKRVSYKPEGYFNNSSSWYGQQVVSAVDDTGRLYSDVGQTEIDELYVGLSNRGAITQAQYDATPSDYALIDLMSYGPGESEVNRDIFDEGSGSPPYSGSVSGVGYMMVHSKDTANKIDKMTVASCNATLSIVSDSITLSNTRENLTGYYGYTADTVPNVWENQPQARPYSSEIQAFPFPYASDLSPRKMYMKGSQIGFSIIPNFGVYERTQYNVFLDTPYERFFVASGVFNSNTQPIATDHEIYPYGWLHVSNGVNVLQAYIVQSLDYGDQRRMWLDGVEYGSALTGAIGCSINDIRAVLFDIKLKDIKKLK